MTRQALRPACMAALVTTLAMAMLGGCASSLSGLSGSSNYACKAPEGVTCQSVSGTYANTVADRPAAVHAHASPQAAVAPSAVASVSPATAPPSVATPLPVPSAPASTPSSAPIRSAPLILRLWFKAWEDADGDLFDQGHIYVQINGGRWLVEHAQRTNREAHSPVRSAGVRGASAPPPTATARTPLGPAKLAPLPRIPSMPGVPARPSTEEADPDQERD